MNIICLQHQVSYCISPSFVCGTLSLESYSVTYLPEVASEQGML
jgi:hypothetical protein